MIIDDDDHHHHHFVSPRVLVLPRLLGQKTASCCCKVSAQCNQDRLGKYLTLDPDLSILFLTPGVLRSPFNPLQAFQGAFFFSRRYVGSAKDLTKALYFF